MDGCCENAASHISVINYALHAICIHVACRTSLSHDQYKQSEAQVHMPVIMLTFVSTCQS